MSYDVTYSLRMALETGVPELTEVQIMYDGVELTGIAKPFATVEYLQGTPELASAGRDSYVDTFNFQVGLFARDINDRFVLEGKIHDLLKSPEGFTLYHYDELTSTFVDSGTRIVFDDNGFTPIGNDDSSSSTYNFHGYFDVGVKIY